MANTSAPTPSLLSPTHRYVAGALFAMALNQAQLHQTKPLGFFSNEDDPALDEPNSASSSSSGDSVSEDPCLWVHENCRLLRPVFRFLEVDPNAWHGLEETAGSSPAKHHVGAFIRLLQEDKDGTASQNSDQELALSKAVDVMAETMILSASSAKSKKEKHEEYENECREKLVTDEAQSNIQAAKEPPKTSQETDRHLVSVGDAHLVPGSEIDEKPIKEEKMLTYHRKIAVLYELLSACLADKREGDKKCTRRRNGYDARHRVALRLLSTWLDIKWIKMEAIETIIACSAMAVAKQEESNIAASKSTGSKWDKLRRGGIIGAAALTGGTLMAITGGLAAPAIAAGFGALAPTLGTLIPVIGASGFAAAATAAGTVAGSIAVGASFGAAGAGLAGTKMARRTACVDEFEFKAVGENHNKGRLAVGISISGLVFNVNGEDFVRPWEGLNDNLERYVLWWETKILISVSNAIQDWLTSRIAFELMRQGAMLTVLSSLVLALIWPTTLLGAIDFIDSKWTIGIDRSDKAGKLLAEVLLNGLQGNRPVTLVGFSLGARVIFKCLETLAETENNAEIVERVVLIGAPLSIKDENWQAARKMVAGRFVNVYATNDWTLGVAFRASLLTQGLAGIQPVDVPGIENSDVTNVIEGHSSYLWATKQILDQLDLDTYYPVFRIPPQSNQHFGNASPKLKESQG